MIGQWYLFLFRWKYLMPTCGRGAAVEAGGLLQGGAAHRGGCRALRPGSGAACGRDPPAALRTLPK
jgi:hypothetical protein